MKVCNSCNENKRLYSEEINICPNCGDILESIYNKDILNGINIELDFTQIKCDCGNEFLYEALDTFGKCPECGDAYKGYKDDIDPRAKLRKNRFYEVEDLISSLEVEISNLKSKIKENKVKKVLLVESREFIQSKIEEISILSDKNIFRNIRFYSDELENECTDIKMQEIKLYISSLYNLHKELLLNEVVYAWKNAFFRLYEVVKKYLYVNKLIINSIVADNFTESKKIMKLAQNKLNSATEDLEVLSDMLQIKNLEETTDREFNVFDLMRLGKLNEFKGGYITNEFIRIQENSFNYFKEFLPNDMDYYKSLEFEILSNLSSYKVLVITSFLETRFKPKVRNVIKVLELAKNKNLKLLKEVIDNFKLKYIYALNTINDVTQIDDLNLKYYKNERLLIRNTMMSYKDFIEGVYRDIMSVIVASSYIIDGKPLNYQEIKSLNFGEKLNYIENKKPKKKNKNLNLYILSGGINKEFRHAEAHVDYEIDNKSKTILLRNKKECSQKNIGKKYSFEDFYMLYAELKETIYSIIIGLEIFIANNYEEFSDFITYVNEQIVNEYEGYLFELYLNFMGIRQLQVNKYTDGGMNTLHIKGISEEYSNIELLEACMQSIAGDAKKNIDIDIIKIELFDFKNIKIGSIRMVMKYLRKYFEVEENLKNYQILLYYFTSEINYEYSTYIDNKRDSYGINFILKTLENFLNSITNKNFKQIIEELKYIVYIFDEYKEFILVENESTLSIMKSLIHEIINQNEELFNGNKLNEQQCIEYIYTSMLELYNQVNFEDNSKLIENTNQKHNKIKIGRNESCPCGSGKKFKKCCGK